MPRKPAKPKAKKARSGTAKKAQFVKYAGINAASHAKKRWDATAVIHQDIYSAQEIVE